MKAPWIVFGLLALIAPAAGHAQSVEIGERVRVHTTDGERVTATLVEITPSALQLRDDDGERLVMREYVSSVERSLGDRRRFGRNFLITTAVGALAVGTMTLVMDDDTCNDQPGGCLDAGGAFIIGAILGGIVSAPIGLIVGATVRSEHWEPTTLPASFSGARVALALSLSVSRRRSSR